MDTSVTFPPTASATLANPMGAFLAKATIEVTGKQIEKFPLLQQHMPAGAKVFIALIEAQDLEAQVTAAAELRKMGFEPIPHIPARFVRDEADLDARLTAFKDKAGVTTVLALGGGAPEPIGKFDAAIQLMKTGLFQKAGITRIGIAGHPEGNPDITKKHGEAVLLQALKDKNDWLSANGMEGFIATQFLFEAGPLALWAASLREAGINLPINVGVPGPATIKTLVKYAAMCGVGNSARFIRKQALNITKLLTVSEPTEFVDQLARLHFDKPELNIAHPHLYPFGGFDKLFTWMGNSTKA
jgi:methylenetetrahydrofolate reductase (NADPH)